MDKTPQSRSDLTTLTTLPHPHPHLKSYLSTLVRSDHRGRRNISSVPAKNVICASHDTCCTKYDYSPVEVLGPSRMVVEYISREEGEGENHLTPSQLYSQDCQYMNPTKVCCRASFATWGGGVTTVSARASLMYLPLKRLARCR